jgi:hypothetical protein
MKAGRGQRWSSYGSSCRYGIGEKPMPMKLKRKRFANRAEEAAWWEANEKAVADSFEKTLNEG